MEEELEYLNKLRGTLFSKVSCIDKDNYEDYLSLRGDIKLVGNIITAVQEYELMTT